MDFLSAVVAMLLGTVLVLGASLTGNQQELCNRLGGTYTPANAAKGQDVCPGGSWGALFASRPQPKPTEVKP